MKDNKDFTRNNKLSKLTKEEPVDTRPKRISPDIPAELHQTLIRYEYWTANTHTEVVTEALEKFFEKVDENLLKPTPKELKVLKKNKK